MSDTSGRLTARGGLEAEAAALRVVSELSAFLNSRIRPPELVALLLVGDFGRGEGRVFVDPAGVEHPFGDIEFLLLSANLAGPERAGLEQRLARALSDQSLPAGLSVRIQVVNLAQMRTAPCSVFWCDVRFGHKLLLGDAGPLLAREAFQTGNLPPTASRDHIVHASLPVLAAQIATGADDGALAMQLDGAIVGCGSALLLLLGQYHWSLQERQCRMAERGDVPERFRAAYHDACERSLKHDGLAPEPVLDAAILPEMHLACERLRLHAPEMSWSDYPELACRFSLRQVARAPLSLAARAIDPPVASHPRGIRSWSARLGLRCAPRSEVLALIHPVVAYDLALQEYADLAAQVLDIRSGDAGDLRRAFVQSWLLSRDQDVYAAIARAASLLHGMPTAA